MYQLNKAKNNYAVINLKYNTMRLTKLNLDNGSSIAGLIKASFYPIETNHRGWITDPEFTVDTFDTLEGVIAYLTMLETLED